MSMIDWQYSTFEWIGVALGLGFLFAVGACAGSFLNVVVFRLPEGLSVISPPSRCPRCGVRLRWFDNIPILSWIFLRARCRRCKAGISWQYPIIELISAVFVAGLAVLLFMVPPENWWSAVGGEWWYRQGFSGAWPAYLCWCVTILGLLAMTLIDARTFLIQIQIPIATTLVCWVLWSVQACLPVNPQVVGDWPIPTLDWPATFAAFGGLGGVLLGTALLRAGVLRYSFSDYEDYVRDGETLAHYPHARREMVLEILFLLPCMAGLALGWLAGLAMEGEPSRLVMALGATIGGWLAGGAIAWSVRIFGTLGFGKEAMGMGDVHLLAAVGAGFGWIDPILAFFIAPFSGLLWVVVRAFGDRLMPGLGRALPYGPHLALALILVVFLRPLLLDIGAELFPGLLGLPSGLPHELAPTRLSG